MPEDQAASDRLWQGDMAIRTGSMTRGAIGLPHWVKRVKVLFAAAQAQRFGHAVQFTMQACFMACGNFGVTGGTGRVGIGLSGMGSFKICRGVVAAVAVHASDRTMQALRKIRAYERVEKGRPVGRRSSAVLGRRFGWRDRTHKKSGVGMARKATLIRPAVIGDRENLLGL